MGCVWGEGLMRAQRRAGTEGHKRGSAGHRKAGLGQIDLPSAADQGRVRRQIVHWPAGGGFGPGVGLRSSAGAICVANLTETQDTFLMLYTAAGKQILRSVLFPPAPPPELQAVSQPRFSGRSCEKRAAGAWILRAAAEVAVAQTVSFRARPPPPQPSCESAGEPNTDKVDGIRLKASTEDLKSDCCARSMFKQPSGAPVEQVF